MAATRTQRIIYTVVSAAIIVIISIFYRYKPDPLKDQVGSDWSKPERMNINLFNQNAEGKWIELHCKGYIHRSRNTSVTHWPLETVLLQSGGNGTLTLPEISDSDGVNVSCNYRGWNGCQVKDFEVFEHPGIDIYYCSESVRKCSIFFEYDGSVDKHYGDRETIILGHIPTPENLDECSRLGCLLDPQSRVIGSNGSC